MTPTDLPLGATVGAGDAAVRVEGDAAPVTVIVPTYNRADLIGQALDSLLGQTLPPKEILVVVDGSTDGTMAVLEAYGERIRVVRTENGGKARALNLGLSLAGQPFVWIFDDDDVACPDALERLHAALSASPEAGFSYGTLDTFFGAWPSPVSEPRTSYRSPSRCALYIAFMQDFFIWQGRDAGADGVLPRRGRVRRAVHPVAGLRDGPAAPAPVRGRGRPPRDLPSAPPPRRPRAEPRAPARHQGRGGVDRVPPHDRQGRSTTPIASRSSAASPTGRPSTRARR
jgi:hypothetical protein